jgi:hypothetical protein
LKKGLVSIKIIVTTKNIFISINTTEYLELIIEAQLNILKILDKSNNKKELVVKLEEDNLINKNLNLEIVQLLLE